MLQPQTHGQRFIPKPLGHTYKAYVASSMGTGMGGYHGWPHGWLVKVSQNVFAGINLFLCLGLGFPKKLVPVLASGH